MPQTALSRLSHRPGATAGRADRVRFPSPVNWPDAGPKQLVEHALDEQGVLLIINTTMWGSTISLVALLEQGERHRQRGAGATPHPVSGHQQAQPGGSHQSHQWKKTSRSRVRYITFGKGRVGCTNWGISSWICWNCLRKGMDIKVQNKGLLRAVDGV